MILRGLVRLAFVRALRPAPCLVGAGLLAWVLATSSISGSARLAAGEEFAPLWEHGALRNAGWSLAALFGLSWIALQALGTLSGWRRRDVDWLAPRAANPLALLLSTWLGLLLALGLLAFASAVAVELSAGRGLASWSEGPRAIRGEGGWLEFGSTRGEVLDCGALPAGSHLRLRFAFASGGPDARVLAVLRDPAGGAELARREQSVGTGGDLELACPAVPARAELRLACTEPGLRVYHDASAARVWLPESSERAASLALLARLMLDAASLFAFALAVSGWFSPSSGLFALLALALVALGSDTGVWPLSGLGGALAVLREGRVPAWPSARECAGSAAVSALSLALAAASLVRWRRER
ncbi:MAG: hypothetical protein IPJ19_17640 [Planctomycetes bacterium]|nr:hypothetical protein [Planctomycetota bacterium]